MNILLTSIGRRALIVEYFREALVRNGGGEVYATDADPTASAIRLADGFFLVPRITESHYVDSLLKVCARKRIAALLSFIDPELEVLARAKSRFAEVGTKVLVPDAEMVEICYDKRRTCEFLMRNGVPAVDTYRDVERCVAGIESGQLFFPLIVKPARGSASLNVQKVDDIEELRFFCSKVKNYVVQEYLPGPEYGVDVLRDLHGEVVAVFVKKKLSMRAGETDKAISVKAASLLEVGVKVGELVAGPGPLDIDVFEKDAGFVVSEINPRFGGGYPSAYECGVDFMDMIVKMLQGKRVSKSIGQYEENVYSSKHDHIAVFKAA